MKMKKLLVMMGTCVYVSSAYAAPDNIITFQGEVTDETCSVAVNGEDATPVILLETVSKSDLAKSGDTAGLTQFDIAVSGCTGNASGVSISTVFVGNQVTANGNLGNTGDATNVEVQVLDSSGTEINFTGGHTDANALDLAANEKASSATYKVQYYATGAATAGTVSASLQYAVSYP